MSVDDVSFTALISYAIVSALCCLSDRSHVPSEEAAHDLLKHRLFEAVRGHKKSSKLLKSIWPSPPPRVRAA